MSGQNFIVPARSWAALAEIALMLRARFGLSGTAYLPIIELIEKILDNRMSVLRLLIGDKAEMGSAEGYTCPKGSFIMLRDDVYRGACSGDARDRFTATHELAHWAIHTNIPLARAMPEQSIKPYRLSEPQANQLASELLMPSAFISMRDTVADVMERHGVSFKAASNRLDYLARKGGLAR